MYKQALIAGIVFSVLAVILGAFGAHGLKPLLTPEQLQTFDTGVKYEFYHAFALIATGIIYSSFPFKQVKYASICFILGIVMFSGSIYAMTTLKLNDEVGLGGLGIITPIGGLFFIIGWILLLLGIVRKK